MQLAAVLAALALGLASPGAAQTALPQEPPVLEPPAVPAAPPGLPRLEEPLPEMGFWPSNQLYALSVDHAGRGQTAEWLQNAMKSLQKNAYRKHYIEEGYFLIPLYGPEQPLHDDYMLFLPIDPGSEPIVIFMKDVHRLAEGAKGSADAIVDAMLSGDKNLIKLAGRTLFDSKLTAREWSHDLGGESFRGTDAGGHPYYYKFRQSGFTKLRVEGGIGGSLKLDKDALYLGGGLGVEAHATLRRSELRKDAVPRAKVGLWGKLPGVEGASFGLSAIQSWHADNGLFESELRLGVFQGEGSASAGLVAYGRVTGPQALSVQGQAAGVQAFYSPNRRKTISGQVEWSRAENRDKDDLRAYLSYDIIERPAADPDGWAAAALGAEDSGRARAALLEAAARLLRQLKENPRKPELVLALARRDAARELPPLAAAMPGGTVVALPAADILESARGLEMMKIGQDYRGSVVPGWAPDATRPLSPAQALERLLSRLPPADRRQIEEAAGPGLGEQFAAVLMIHAPPLRRRGDCRARRALGLLHTVLKKAIEDPYASARGGLGGALWTAASKESRETLERLQKDLQTALNWQESEYAQEEERWRTGLVEYGRKKIDQARPAWPSAFALSLRDSDFAALLAGHGEADLGRYLWPFVSRAQTQSVSLNVVWEQVRRQARLQRAAPQAWTLFLPSFPGADRRAFARETLSAIAAALAAQP